LEGRSTCFKDILLPRSIGLCVTRPARKLFYQEGKKASFWHFWQKNSSSLPVFITGINRHLAGETLQNIGSFYRGQELHAARHLNPVGPEAQSRGKEYIPEGGEARFFLYFFCGGDRRPADGQRLPSATGLDARGAMRLFSRPAARAVWAWICI
jgi:hypothetical protein